MRIFCDGFAILEDEPHVKRNQTGYSMKTSTADGRRSVDFIKILRRGARRLEVGNRQQRSQ